MCWNGWGGWSSSANSIDQAEVVTPNLEAETVCVRYLDALGEPELVGTEVWLSADEILTIDMGTHAEGRT